MRIPMTPGDLYYAARFIDGKSLDGLRANPWLMGLIDNGIPRTQIIELLGDSIKEVTLVDANGPPPTPKRPGKRRIPAPDLPEPARLTDAALKAAEGAGAWLDQYTNWASARAPMTPRLFLESGGLFAISLAVARRCFIHLHEPIFPHLYILWVAPSGIFRKTTGLNCADDLIRSTMRHMLLPEEMTPESFMDILSGNAPPNFSELSRHEQELINQGRAFAAQRGLLLDEASSLLGANRKDYLKGMTELLLLMYDAKPDRQRWLKGGFASFYNGSLSILGATTPAAMVRTVREDSWGDGMMARMVLLSPEGRLPYDLGSSDRADYDVPAGLAAALKRLHESLPEPPDPLDFGGDAPPEMGTLTASIDPDAYAAYDAYAKAVTYDLIGEEWIDPRIQPNYVRMHIQAVKVALLLACIDWATEGSEPAPRITLGHWAKAQIIAELWREALHRLLDVLDISEDEQNEDRILTLLIDHPEGLTRSDIMRATGINAKRVKAALEVMLESGLAMEMPVMPGPEGGRPTTRYIPMVTD